MPYRMAFLAHLVCYIICSARPVLDLFVPAQADSDDWPESLIQRDFEGGWPLLRHK